jgi:carotenoid 1,2-hydratase
VDAVSDDGHSALTLIAMLGTSFSPAYARARAAGAADPLEFCTMNVALYGRAGSAWAMTERPRWAVARDSSSVSIGASSMRWTGRALEVELDERSAPFAAPLRRGSPIRGKVKLFPTVHTDEAFALDGVGEHLWAPLAPAARVEVELSEPGVRFSGLGYWDRNRGDVPLERTFARWSWARAVSAKVPAVTYRVEPKVGAPSLLAGTFSRDGRFEDGGPLAVLPLGDTRWGLERPIAADPASRVWLEETFEDAPFYARSLARVSLFGRSTRVVHEALSLERFGRPWVQRLLPFRMRRTP